MNLLFDPTFCSHHLGNLVVATFYFICTYYDVHQKSLVTEKASQISLLVATTMIAIISLLLDVTASFINKMNKMLIG